jgi:oligopeptide/dipeptide ABC transporter ATP-binding protein
MGGPMMPAPRSGGPHGGPQEAKLLATSAAVAKVPTSTPLGAAPVLAAADLTKDYTTGGGRVVRALRGVSLSLAEGSTAGVVGESGCGKSTLARLLVGLERPTSGKVEVLGEPVEGTPRLLLARRAQLVFQDPFSSLNPRLVVGEALSEVLAVHHLAPAGGKLLGKSMSVFRSRRGSLLPRVERLLDLVALSRRFADRYPHELSGGQAQRVAIARALAAEPRALVLDEPTSALDVSVRAEVINLLVRLQEELGLSYVFVSHDLAVVRHISDVICVMYLGKVVEQGPWEAVLTAPLHPYTRALAEAVPIPDPEREASRRLSASQKTDARPSATMSNKAASAGQGPGLGAGETVSGCPYHPRCPLAEDICRSVAPGLVELSGGHSVACHVAARDFKHTAVS